RRAGLLRRRVEDRRVPVGHAVLGQRRLALPKPVEREEGVPQDLEQPGAEVGSRLEPMGEAEGPEVGLLDQVLGLGRVAGQIDGEVEERVQVLEGLPFEVGLGHGYCSNHSGGTSAILTSWVSSSSATSSRI